MNAFRIGLALATLALAGCLTSSEDYVQQHGPGSYVVRGTLISMNELSSRKFERLDDAFALRTSDAGCVVVLKQEMASGASKQTRFELIAGDRIVVTGDGSEGNDYVISALKNKVGIDVEPEGQRDD